MLAYQDKIKLVLLTNGILITFILMGFAIEKIFKGSFEGETFTFSISFVAIQCIVYSIVAKVFLTFKNATNETPQKYYIFIAIFYLIGMVTANMALFYVSYPVQVIGKACKPIPVMIFGLILVRKSYSLQKYIFVLAISIGVAIFIYKKDNDIEHNFLNFGNMFIGISLLADGLLGASQDIMRKVSRPCAFNFMFYVNAWSSLILCVILLANGEGIECVKFIIRHHEVLLYLGAVLIAGTFGQFFLSSMITNFGSLPFAIVSTLRKFLTVLLSCLIYHNTLSIQQWIATGIIFLVLTMDVVLGQKEKDPENQIKNDENIKDVEKY